MIARTRTSAARLSAHERAQEALRLRTSGMRYEAIAAEVGYNSRQAAFKAVTSIIARQDRHAVDEHRAVQDMRLDAALAAIWVAVEAGDLYAIDRLIRLEERRAKLLGIDAPIKIAPTDPTGEEPYAHLSDAELLARVTTLAAGGIGGDSGGTGAPAGAVTPPLPGASGGDDQQSDA